MKENLEYAKFSIKAINIKHNSIYHFLKENNFSENQIKKLRKNEKSFILNGTICNIKERISNGDILEILINPEQGSKIPPCEGILEILFEDDDFLIVNKPHSLACIPTRSHYNNNLGGMIVKYMQNKSPNFVLRIINRLDKDTAGIIVVTKNASAYNNIGKINKTYYAICHGKPQSKNFTINQPILTKSENGINQMKRIVHPDGKQSITHVNLIKTKNNLSLIKLQLETGRTHQVRVHLSHIGHSLYGDSIYSASADKNITHTFLILKEISFIHPKTKNKISIEVDFPNEWKEFI